MSRKIARLEASKLGIIFTQRSDVGYQWLLIPVYFFIGNAFWNLVT
jgi:hypothetical protein